MDVVDFTALALALCGLSFNAFFYIFSTINDKCFIRL